MKVLSVMLCNVNCHLRNLCNENCNLRFRFRKFIGFVTLASLTALDRHWHLRRWTSILAMNFNSSVTENSLIKLSWYLVLWGEIGKKCCRREKMVHIFHNKETPLYKRFPDGWPTKAKWKTLPVSILPQPQLNIIMTTFLEAQAFLKKTFVTDSLWVTLTHGFSKHFIWPPDLAWQEIRPDSR